MALIEEHGMGMHHSDSEDLHFGLAVAAELRRRHPVHTIKMVARDLECTPKLAENFLAGRMSGKSVTRLVKAYGLGFLIDVGVALTGASLDSFILEQSERALHEQQKWELERQRLRGLSESVRGIGLFGGPRSEDPRRGA